MKRDSKTGRFVLLRPNDNLLVTNPYVAKLWHPTKNGKLKPEHVTRKMKMKIWLFCDNNLHEPYKWSLSVLRARGREDQYKEG